MSTMAMSRQDLTVVTGSIAHTYTQCAEEPERAAIRVLVNKLAEDLSRHDPSFSKIAFVAACTSGRHSRR